MNAPKPNQPQKELDLSHLESASTESVKVQALAEVKKPSVEDKPDTFRKIDPGAKIPLIKTANSAGADICSLHRIRCEAGRATAVHTGIALARELPQGTFIVMELRSSLRFTKNLSQMGIGVIDGDYKGEIRGLIFNHGPNDVIIDEGERFAQLLFLQHETHLYCQSEATERGEKGIGSTGK